jgi:hypothetical protein
MVEATRTILFDQIGGQVWARRVTVPCVLVERGTVRARAPERFRARVSTDVRAPGGEEGQLRAKAPASGVAAGQAPNSATLDKKRKKTT